MPYGGCGQLKYLCGSDESGTDALISLTRLNRHSALIADSDKKQESDPLSKHVKRLAQEIVAGNGFAWVTQGRELENYPQPSNLEAAAKMLRHTFVRMADATQYGDCEKVIIANTVGAEIQVDLDKVPLAHTVVSLGIDPGRFDCPEKLAQLITFIRKSNGIAN